MVQAFPLVPRLNPPRAHKWEQVKWAFDLEKESWQELAVSVSKPITRYGTSAILDVSRNRMNISHDFSAEVCFDDTWAFDLTKNTWTNLTAERNETAQALSP